MSRPRYVFILSDATGDTASRVVRAALKQFVGEDIQVRRHANVLRKSEVRAVLKEAAETGSLVAHTFAARPLRRALVSGPLSPLEPDTQRPRSGRRVDRALLSRARAHGPLLLQDEAAPHGAGGQRAKPP